MIWEPIFWAPVSIWIRLIDFVSIWITMKLPKTTLKWRYHSPPSCPAILTCQIWWPAGYTGNFYTEYGILNEGYGTILPYFVCVIIPIPAIFTVFKGFPWIAGCQKGPFILPVAQLPSTVRVHQFVSPVKKRNWHKIGIYLLMDPSLGTILAWGLMLPDTSRFQ